MGLWSMSLDPQSLAEIARFSGWEAYLSPAVQAALLKGAETVRNAAVANTWSAFRNPQGTLAGSIEVVPDSRYEIQVSVGVPYGHRREFSFHGPDALGRVFPNDPAEPYLIPAMNANQQAVLTDVEIAVETALGRIAYG